MNTLNAERPTSSLTVLVVEDERLLRWSLAATLRKAGCTVHEAGSATEARRVLDQLQNHVDVILQDYRLPDADGSFPLVEEIQHRVPNGRIIMMTGYGTPEMKAQASRLGVQTVLSKPFNLDAIVPYVAGVL